MIPVEPDDGHDAPLGGTFVRPGAIVWGRSGADEDPYVPAEAIEQILLTVAKDPDRVSDLLDDLARARLWLPLPAADRPVVKGSAVSLPTVTYLGAEFVPAFTSLRRLTRWTAPEGRRNTGLIPAQYRPDTGDATDGLQAHMVVPAADLARQLPPGLGIALNPGGDTSVPIYPDGVAHLAASERAGQTPIRLGHPAVEPLDLLREVSHGLETLDAVRHAARAWLTVPGQGEGLVISVTLDDPASAVAHDAVITVVERAATAVPDATFPIDVTFPGETEPDQIDTWITANTTPFYVRG
jgi:SseB protein C-terminal domain/SseB protein N-terminal domain